MTHMKGYLLAFLVTIYVLASHIALILPHGKSLAAALALAVPALVLFGFGYQFLIKKMTQATAQTKLSKPMLAHALRVFTAGVLAIIPVFVCLWFVWPMASSNSESLYFFQHVGTNALFAWIFGRTLAKGHTPLVVTFAKMVHQSLPQEIENYARQVTWAWTWFFVLTCLISILLFTMASITTWSTFAVLLQWPLVAAFFVAEYAMRRYLFRHFEHASLRQGFEAYQQSQKQKP